MKTKSKILGIVLVLAMLLSMMSSTTAIYASEGIEAQMEELTLSAYPNNGTTNHGDGTFTLDTSAGDAQLYWWADPINAAMAEGKGVQISMTAEIPAGNADSTCFSLGYMRGTGNDHSWKAEFTNGLAAGTNNIVLTIQADGSFVSTVNGVEDMTGNMLTELAGQPLWNICFHSSMAAGHANSATVSDFSAETVADGNAPAATQAPVTEAPVTEEPTLTEAPEEGFSLSAYPNNGTTNNGNGTFTLDTSAGDAQLYWWADPVNAAMGEGKGVQIAMTAEIPAVNADRGCFSLGYMRGTGNDHNWRGSFTNSLEAGTNRIVLTIMADGSFVSTVNGVQNMTGNMLTSLAGQPLWNVCFHSSMAAGHANTAIISDVSATTFEGGNVPTAPTQAPVTEAPDGTTEAPTAAPLGLSPYPNNGCTDNHDGTYDLNTSGGDAQLYWWADSLLGALEEGMSVQISMVVDVAAGNADGGCFSLGYMRGTGNDHNWKGELSNGLSSGRNDLVVIISPDGSFVTTVNGEEDMTGNMLTELAGQPLWNICFHSSMAAGHANSATVSDFSAIKFYGDAPSAEPTQAPTEAPTQTPSEAPSQAPNPIQASIRASLSANGGAIDGLTGSTTVVVVTDATVTSGEDLTAVLAIIVYDGAGKIVNIAYEEVEIDAEVNSSVTKALEAGFNLPSNIEGYKIRIAVYDDLVNLNQLVSISYTIE